MVTKQAFLFIETLLFRVTVGISLSILLFFFFTIGLSSLRNLRNRIRIRIRWKILTMLFEYLLEEIPLEGVRYRRVQRGSVVDAFATVIAAIKGFKKERMKNAASALGLIREVARGLKSNLPASRMRACHTLGILGSEEYSDLIIERLYDSNRRVISSAIISLGEIRSRNAVRALLELYKRCTLSQAWLIAAILPFFGHETFEYIRPQFMKQELAPSRLILLIKVTSGFKLTASLEVLQHLYKQSDSLDVRINALLAIGNINDLFAVKTVIDALSDAAWQVRAVACNIIGEMAIKGAADRLVSLLKDKSWFVRKNSAAALVRLGRIGIMGLFTALNSNDRYARDMVVQTLQEHGILESVMHHLGGRDEVRARVAYRVARFLAKRGYKNYLENYRSLYPMIAELL